MKRTRIITSGCMSVLLLLMAAVLLTGCSSDGVTYGDAHDGSPLELKAAVVSGLATRSTTASDNAWTVGDIVTVLDGSDNTKHRYTITNASTGALDGDIVWGDEGTTKTVTAWSYGGGTYTTTLPASWSVATDQSQASYMQTNDFLYSPAVTATKGQSTTLTFAHETSMIFIRLKCSDGSITSASGITSVNLKAANVGTFSYSGTPAAASWSIGNATLVAMQPLSGTASGYLATFTALIIPQDMSGKEFLQFIATFNGTQKTYVYTPGTGEAKFGAGYKYIYDVNFSCTKVTVTAVSATWGYGSGTAAAGSGTSDGAWNSGDSGSSTSGSASGTNGNTGGGQWSDSSGSANGTNNTGSTGNWTSSTSSGSTSGSTSGGSWISSGSLTTTSGTASGTSGTSGTSSWGSSTGDKAGTNNTGNTGNWTGDTSSGGTSGSTSDGAWTSGTSGSSTSGTASGTSGTNSNSSWGTNNGTAAGSSTSTTGSATWSGGTTSGVTGNGTSGGTWTDGGSGSTTSTEETIQ